MNELEIAKVLIQYVAPICRRRKVEVSELDAGRVTLMFAGYLAGVWDKSDVKAKTNELCDKAIVSRGT